MPDAENHQSISGDPDFRRLWTGQAVSQFGTAVGSTALPVVALDVLHTSTFGVTLLAALTSITTLLVALPIGHWAEFHAKRAAMIAADGLRFVALLSVPIAYVLHRLTFAQLGVVAVLTGFGQLLFLAAAQAHLTDLVSRPRLVDANSRLLSSTWLSLSIGPALGGVLIDAVNAVSTMLVDAVSYLASAAAIVLIRKPESPPTRPAGDRSVRSELLSGAAFLFSRPDLRRLLISWIGYVGCIALTTPLTAVLYLRVLHFSKLQYGLILGLPSLAGFVGSRLTRRAVTRFGSLRTIRWAALLRIPGLVVIPLAGRGWLGVLVCGVGFAALLLFSSLGNAAMTGYRQLRTPDDLLARTATFWSFAPGLVQPVLILAGGALATAIGVRAGLLVAAAGVLLSALVLPSATTAEL